MTMNMNSVMLLGGGRDEFPLWFTQTIDAVCRAIRKRDGLREVRLSGGVFQNWTLLKETPGFLRGDGFRGPSALAGPGWLWLSDIALQKFVRFPQRADAILF
jgi:hypothetical protein